MKKTMHSKKGSSSFITVNIKDDAALYVTRISLKKEEHRNDRL
jgi:hypothetical protein